MKVLLIPSCLSCEGLNDTILFILWRSWYKILANKISHGRGNSLRNKVRGWVELDSPELACSAFSVQRSVSSNAETMGEINLAPPNNITENTSKTRISNNYLPATADNIKHIYKQYIHFCSRGALQKLPKRKYLPRRYPGGFPWLAPGSVAVLIEYLNTLCEC